MNEGLLEPESRSPQPERPSATDHRPAQAALTISPPFFAPLTPCSSAGGVTQCRWGILNPNWSNRRGLARTGVLTTARLAASGWRRGDSTSCAASIGGLSGIHPAGRPAESPSLTSSPAAGICHPRRVRAGDSAVHQRLRSSCSLLTAAIPSSKIPEEPKGRPDGARSPRSPAMWPWVGAVPAKPVLCPDPAAVRPAGVPEPVFP